MLGPGASSHVGGVGGGGKGGRGAPSPAFTSCKQSQFCFKEMILFRRSLLNDAFKGLFFFFFLILSI